MLFAIFLDSQLPIRTKIRIGITQLKDQGTQHGLFLRNHRTKLYICLIQPIYQLRVIHSSCLADLFPAVYIYFIVNYSILFLYLYFSYITGTDLA